MKTVGDETRFALSFELQPDPDIDGDPAERASWGRFQIWVAGRNLTAGRTDGTSVDAAEAPLLPVVRWIIDQWDPLLHEERLPRPSYSGSAASWRMNSLATPGALHGSEEQFDQLLMDRESWWARHGLGSALPDFRIPDLHIRRAGTNAEISWDDREWATVPRGMRLVESPSAALFPVGEVAQVLHDWSSSVVAVLAQQSDARSVAEGLAHDLALIRTAPRRLTRLQWAAGQQLDSAARRLRQLLGVTTGDVTETVRSLLGLQTAEGGEIVTSLTVPALLFRSASPQLSPGDLQALLQLAADAPEGESQLAAFQVQAPPPLGGMAITEDGYERALAQREAFGLDPALALTGDSDLEQWLMPRLGIEVADLRLDDWQVDGVAVVSRGRMPIVAVNSTGGFSKHPWGRRMTLAHELCHLLFDIDDDGKLGIVSNPWAPQALERRANAFAAMFLMPPEALEAVLHSVDSSDWTIDLLGDAMSKLGVGKSTLTWHLYNLGWITGSQRSTLVDEL